MIVDSLHDAGTVRAVMTGTGVVVAYTRNVALVTVPGRLETRPYLT